MTPFRFITLHEANGVTDVVVNVNHIVAIRDLRKDPAVKGTKNYQWTNIECVNGKRYDVNENEWEIMFKIAKLQ